MAELTADERTRLEAAFVKVLASSDTVDAEAPTLGVAGVGNPKDLFCKNWDTVKAVLDFLSGVVPIWLRPIIAVLIRLGDAAHATLCR